ncbi:hypothetical protein LTR36_005162 [Oleoguttula mirabilis]|uniref:Uncharacterized protein n=1 Tax=Oleoguttula mirabilis TaxID=1507867 RepID=A0AAV9JW69_9PEZI|nr:hypothetical protein LTR36_005162 [Oleoguttula mirabilis]
MFSFFRRQATAPSDTPRQPVNEKCAGDKVARQPANLSRAGEEVATSSYLLTSDPTTNADSNAIKLNQNFQLSFKYASAATSAQGGVVPRSLPLDMPEHLKQGISEWLGATHGIGAGLEVSAILLHPPKTAHMLGSSVESERCALLSLPPELRNRIYRFVLVESDDIHVAATGPLPVEPGFLRTCSQVRNESSAIYYKKNKFNFVVKNHNARLYVQWAEASFKHYTSNHSFTIFSSTNWPNLLTWAKDYYSCKCHGVASVKAGNEPVAIGHVHSMVEKLRNCPGITWDDAQQMLGDMRQALGTQDKGWLDDDD